MKERWYHLPIGLFFYLPFQLFYRLFCILCALGYFLLFCLRQPISSCCQTRYAKNALPTLITIRFSHYCEKARWALDLVKHVAAQSVTEELSKTTCPDSYRYIECSRSILTHMVSSLWHTSGFSSSTPIYITSEKIVLKDSSDIMHYASNQLCTLGKETLYPSPEVEELENYFNQILGVHVRRYGYWLIFQADNMKNELRSCWLRGTVGFENWIQQHLFGSIKALATKGMNIQEEPSLISKQHVDQVFEKVNKLLEENGGFYLLKTNYPTAADITFAALAYPMILPSQCDDLIVNYDPNVLSRPFYEQVKAYREQPAGKFVLRMYEQHRVVNRIQPNQS